MFYEVFFPLCCFNIIDFLIHSFFLSTWHRKFSHFLRRILFLLNFFLFAFSLSLNAKQICLRLNEVQYIRNRVLFEKGIALWNLTGMISLPRQYIFSGKCRHRVVINIFKCAASSHRVFFSFNRWLVFNYLRYQINHHSIYKINQSSAQCSAQHTYRRQIVK